MTEPQPSRDSIFKPATFTMAPRELCTPASIAQFYRDFSLQLAPNMPRMRSWAQVHSTYFDSKWAEEVVQQVAGGAAFMDIGSGPKAVMLSTLMSEVRKRQPQGSNINVVAVDPTIDPQDPTIDSEILKLRTSAESLAGVADNSMDRALATEVYQYVVDKPAFIAKIWRVLKPDAFCEIIIDNLRHDSTGTSELLHYSDIPPESYEIAKTKRGATVLRIKKQGSKAHITFDPYRIFFLGIEKVADYPPHSAARRENAFIATEEQQPYLADGLYYPRFEYEFTRAGEMERLNLWKR